MASFSVPWSNNGGNLEEIQSCMSHTQSSSRSVMLCRKNFLSYGLRNHHTCNAQKLSNVVGVKNFSGSSATNSSAARSDEKYLSSSGSSSSSSVVDHGKKIFSTRKRMVDKEEDFSGKLDQWVKDSVVEIVNYLDEAPFLVHIYSDGEEGSTCTSFEKKKNKLVKEKAIPESWPLIKERWDGGISPTPQGIILVEEMKCSEEEGDCPCKENLKNLDMNVNNKQHQSSSCNKVWGILIQGKGANYPACYLLKTCRVPCVSGFCTHFCLVRVECFYEHLDIQFKKLWLL